MGKRLLIRGSKKVTLIEDGMLSRKHAEEMIDLMKKSRQNQILLRRTLYVWRCMIETWNTIGEKHREINLYFDERNLGHGFLDHGV